MSDGVTRTEGQGSGPVRGVVLAHAGMARGLVEAVLRISGADEDALVAQSNEGFGPEELAARVDELVGKGPAIVFTDLAGGSCTMAARLVCRQRPLRAVICGANLAMLLDFVFNREMEVGSLVDRLVEKGRESVRAFTAQGADAP